MQKTNNNPKKLPKNKQPVSKKLKKIVESIDEHTNDDSSDSHDSLSVNSNSEYSYDEFNNQKNKTTKNNSNNNINTNNSEIDNLSDNDDLTDDNLSDNDYENNVEIDEDDDNGDNGDDEDDNNIDDTSIKSDDFDDAKSDNNDNNDAIDNNNEDCFYRFKNNKVGELDDNDDSSFIEDIYDDDNKEHTDKYVLPENRITQKKLLFYERVRVLTERATQLSLGAVSMLDDVKGMGPKEIAKMELKLKKIPFFIDREMCSGQIERFDVNELEICN
jgi:DNA-directed RNA polymerase subunit K/omega